MISKIASRFGKGFTLIELMIVVAIIGILAAIAIPNFIKFQCRSKQSEAKTNLKAMFVAQESYRAEYEKYAGLECTTADGAAGDCSNAIGFSPKGAKVRYSYVATANGSNTGATFTGTATGTGDVDGDTWTINESNNVTNTVNECQ